MNLSSGSYDLSGPVPFPIGVFCSSSSSSIMAWRGVTVFSFCTWVFSLMGCTWVGGGGGGCSVPSVAAFSWSSTCMPVPVGCVLGGLWWCPSMKGEFMFCPCGEGHIGRDRVVMKERF